MDMQLEGDHGADRSVRAGGWLAALVIACAATVALPARAETVAARAIADILTADDIAEICPDEVRRRGPQETGEFITEGIRVLIADGHSKVALYDVTRQVPREEMYALMDRRIAERGKSFDEPKELCRFARDVAGTNDRVGRFLVRVE